MKKISKILSIVLVLAMVMSFALVAHAEEVTATISFADTSTRTSFSTEQQIWESNGIKLTNNKSGAKANVADYSNPARFYQNSDVIIEYPGMTKIVMVCPTEAYAQVWVDTNTDDNATITHERTVADDKNANTIVTIEFANPTDSFSLINIVKQTRIREMTVYAEVAEEEPEAPAGTAIADGEYVIYVPAYNKALSSVYGGFYNNGVDVDVADGVVSGYGDSEVWTVTNNDDGTISISFGGKNLGMADSFTSMTLGEAHDKWVLSDAGNGLFYAMNTVREAYIEWYDGKSYWSAYYNINAGSEGMFALAFYPIVEEEPEQPEEPAKVDYYVAGQDTLCGSNWNPGDEANIMTQGEDGLYTKVYENVAAGVYELKVTVGDWTESWGDATSTNGNYFATVEALSTVTVIFDAETKTVSVEIVPVETEPENPGEGGEVNPGTGDMAIAGLALAMMAATAGVVVLKKKEF